MDTRSERVARKLRAVPCNLGALCASFPLEAHVRVMRWLLAAVFLVCVVLSAPLDASPITFSFDTSASNPLPDDAPSSSSQASKATIQKYMRKIIFDELGIANGVTVAGAKVEGNNSYTGDNHVVGPVLPGNNKATSLTLGNSDGAYSQQAPLGLPHDPARQDGYIYNSDSVMFSMVFLFPIYKVTFDYQIFPNGTCGNPANAGTPSDPDAGGGNCSVWPDFTFKAGNSVGTMTTHLHSVSQDPYDAGYAGYTRSPISGTNPATKEKAPQLLSVSGVISFTEPVTRLEFWDWPERIGIDNLVVYNATPEPATLLLIGAGAGVLGFARKRRTAQRS